MSLVGSLPDIFPVASLTTQTNDASFGYSTASIPQPSDTTNSRGSNSQDGKQNINVIAGGAVAGSFGLTLIAGLIYFLFRTWKKEQQHKPPSTPRGSGTNNARPPIQAAARRDSVASFAYYGPRRSFASSRDDIPLHSVDHSRTALSTHRQIRV